MNATPSARGWPWGLIALALSALTWMALVVGVLAFTAGFRPPGDGNNGVQATQWWLLGALVTMVLCFPRQPGGDGVGLATATWPHPCGDCRCIAGDAGLAGPYRDRVQLGLMLATPFGKWRAAGDNHAAFVLSPPLQTGNRPDHEYDPQHPRP